MRNPVRKAWIWGAVLAAGLTMLAYGIPRFETYAPSPLAAVIAAILGFVISITGAIFFLQYALSARGLSKLMRERDAGALVARWHVGPADLERFRDIDRARAAEHSGLANDFVLPARTPPLGLDILVGDTGILAGDSYHVLRRHGLPGLVTAGWLAAVPECLEFGLVYPRRYGAYYRALRLPVPGAARAQGVAAYHHFERRAPGIRQPPIVRHPRLSAALALAVVLAGACACWYGWQLKEAGDEGQTPNIWMASGFAAAATAAIILIALFASRIGRR